MGQLHRRAVNAKALSAVTGHSTITFDRYGPLMPGGLAEATAAADVYVAKLAEDSGAPACHLGPGPPARCAWRDGVTG
jgi:hypothetical protein